MGIAEDLFNRFIAPEPHLARFMRLEDDPEVPGRLRHAGPGHYVFRYTPATGETVVLVTDGTVSDEFERGTCTPEEAARLFSRYGSEW